MRTIVINGYRRNLALAMAALTIGLSFMPMDSRPGCRARPKRRAHGKGAGRSGKQYLLKGIRP